MFFNYQLVRSVIIIISISQQKFNEKLKRHTDKDLNRNINIRQRIVLKITRRKEKLLNQFKLIKI